MFNARLDHPSDSSVNPAAQFPHGCSDIHVQRGAFAKARGNTVFYVGHDEVHEFVVVLAVASGSIKQS